MKPFKLLGNHYNLLKFIKYHREFRNFWEVLPNSGQKMLFCNAKANYLSFASLKTQKSEKLIFIKKIYLLFFIF
jgi:hypothetical protein